MGPRLRGPHPRRAKTDRQNAIGPQRARDASAAREGSGAAESADEGGESASWWDEKNRGPGRIPMDEHDQKGAGAEASGSRRAQTKACEADRQQGIEEELGGLAGSLRPGSELRGGAASGDYKQCYCGSD